MRLSKKQKGINLLLVVILILIVGVVIWVLLKHPSLLKRSPIESAKQVLNTLSGTKQAGLPTAVQLQNREAVLLEVPFTAQAPFAEWSDQRQQDACEEASVIMAMHWVKNQPIASKQAAKDEILAISHYESDNFGSYRDTSAADTAKRIIEGYYKYTNYEIKPVKSTDDIIIELNAGHLVVVPANGRALGQPNFTQPGPERHMFVIKGYDRLKQQFITNDPGISQGENWRYNREVVFNALRDYTTGDHVPIIGNSKMMIVVKR